MIGADAVKGIPRRDLCHPVPFGPQPCRRLGPQPRRIGKDKPVQRAGQVQIPFGIARLPMRQRAPVADILQPLQRLLGRARRRLTRRDEIARALELIGRQHHAVAPCLAPNLRPISLDPAGPEPPDHPEEIGIIRDLLLGVAQRRHHLPRGHIRVHLRQGGKRLARPDLKENPRRIAAQSVDAIREIHRVTELFDPIIGVRRHLRRDHLAAAVRQEGHLRRAQVKRGEEGAVSVKDRVQHPRVRGDVDGDALMVKTGGVEPLLQRL